MSAARSSSYVQAERRGRLAELLCVIYLTVTGWTVLARRLKSKAGSGLGEVDIIARRGATIAFIEVKARASLDAGLESVTAAQRRRIARAADTYLQRRAELMDCDVRFDVMVLASGFIPRRIADAWRP